MRGKMMAVILILSSIMSTVLSPSMTLAATKSSSNKKSDGVATVTKSAKWTNSGKTEAEITISVETKKIEKTITDDVANGDIIFILDRSGSMGDKVHLDRKTIEESIMKEAATRYLSGNYAKSGNRVAYAEFSTALWLFNDDTTKYRYANSGNQKYVFGYDKILKSTTGIKSAKQARDELLKTLENVPSTLNFYTKASSIETLIDRAKGEWLYGNTDFNLPLIWARCLLENRSESDQTRKPYIVFVTDGQPFPDSESTRKQQAEQTSYRWRKSQYVANKFAIPTAEVLRNNYDAEIYTIILDTGNADYDMWNAITGDKGASSSKDSDHIYSVKNVKTTDAAKNAMNGILSKIYHDMKSRATKVETATLNATLTDIINTDLFSVSKSQNAISTNIGEAKLSKDGKKVTWKFSNILYGSKCLDGKWPTLTVKVNLKDNNTYGDDINTNSIIGGDDKCALTHPEGPGVKVPTPWLERPAPKRNVTIKYVDMDTNQLLYTIAVNEIENQSKFPSSKTLKSIYALDGKGLKKTFGIEGYMLVEDRIEINNKKYTLDTLPKTLTVNRNQIITFYYTKEKAKAIVRTFIVNRLDDAVVGIINHSENKLIVEPDTLQEYAAPKTEKYQYLGYHLEIDKVPFVNTSILDKLDATNSIVEYVLEIGETVYIDFYYLNQEYTYEAVIQYIDDTTNEVLHQIDNPRMRNNVTFPAYGSIASRYLTKDLKGTFGISGYELMENKVMINTQNYSTKTLPKNLQMNEDKIIQFYYRPQNANANIRTFIVTKTDDKVTGIKNNSTLTHSAYADTEYTKDAPNLVNYQYLGYTVKYGDIPIVTADTIKDLDPNQTKAKYKISHNAQKVFVDFIYQEAYNTVTIKYQDTYGNTIKNDDIKVVKNGSTIWPDVPNSITANGTIYDYVKRNDGKSQEDSIGPVTKKTTVIVTYRSKGHTLRLKYKDIITNETIAPDYVQGNIPEYTTVRPTEEGVATKFIFVTRSDGKDRKAGIEITTVDKEIIFYYVNADGAPVVSYPIVDTDRKEEGMGVAILGEELSITIPSRGIHKQMNDLGVAQPTNGWNSVYAKSVFLKFTCDVFYHNELIKAGEVMKVAENKDGGLENTNAKVIIPEYVKEENQSVTAIVSSLVQFKKDSSVNAGYNLLYDESDAVGKANFKVKGKIYDFTISNLKGDSFWPKSSFNAINGYKAGAIVANHIAQLPIGQRTNQNTSYQYGLALGSSFFYHLNTIGMNHSQITILPKLLYVDSNGVQKEVDIYRRNAFNQYQLMPNESNAEFITQLNNDAYKVRTNLTNELIKGSKLYGSAKYSVNTNIGTHQLIKLNENLRVPFVEYMNEENKAHYLSASDVIKDEILKATNHWYGYYYLPATTMVMPKGTSVNDLSKEIKNGFIIVLFKIISTDENGNSYLIYDNQYVGNAWKNEGGASNGEELTIQLPQTIHSNQQNTTMVVKDGYYPVAIYGVGTRLNSDVSGIN